MIRVLEQIGSGLVNGDGARAGGGVGHLARMNGKRGELLLFRFGHDRSFRIALGAGKPLLRSKY